MYVYWHLHGKREETAMRINSINNNYSIYSLYNTMFQGSVSLSSLKMSQSLYPTNMTQGSQKLGGAAVQYINDIKSASKALSGTLKELSGAAFSNRTMTSSNSDTLSVKYTGNNITGVSPMTVKVSQIAEGQQNEGSRMTAAAAYEGSSGTNTFSIETGGKTTQLSVNVAAGDTNKDVQQKMADAINSAGIGVKATVETDAATKTSMLKLESANTGSDPKNSFTVKDVTGDLTAKTGVNEVSREGRDAIYSVNGGAERKSQSNTVNLGNGISATFKKASDEAVTISRGKSTDYAKSAVESLVKSYNDLYSSAAQRIDDPKAQNLATKMISTSKAYSSSLSNIGIGFDKDGKMTIDSKKLDAAAENGRLETFFKENSGRNYGFTNQLSRLSDSVSRNTSNFVSSSLFGSELGQNFSYSSFGDLVQYNYLSSGSIFDYMY